MNCAVLVSGGVDSSLALALLKEQGHHVEAFYLKIWLEDELSSLGSCPWEEDLSFVRALCSHYNVPLHIIPLQAEYHDRVVSYVISEIKAGRTPNPDIMCNEHIKFGAFFDAIDLSKFDMVASGHYAQIIEKNDVHLLARAPDPIKDQTYFLCNLSEVQRKKIVFPIGHLTKEQVRQEALKRNLPSAQRKDSQGICFLGKFKFKDFLTHHCGQKSGAFVEYETGKELGIHEGHWFFTIGQRSGITLSGGPWYVVSKDPEKNSVFISNKYSLIDALRSQFEVNNIIWHSPCIDFNNLSVKIRHRAQPVACQLISSKNSSYSVLLSKKDQGIAPGQFAVFYNDDICIGRAVINA